MEPTVFQALGLHQSWEDLHPRDFRVNGRANVEIDEVLRTAEDRQYNPCPEAYLDGPLDGVVSVFDDWRESRVFAGTKRRIAVYVPRRKNTAEPVNLLLCNDGEAYRYEQGAVRAPQVLESLQKSAELNPTVGVFVMSGVPDGIEPSPARHPQTPPAKHQRSLEYDTCSPQYGEFLLEDVLPFVSRELGINISTDPARRALCGISSGGICAFNAAWHFPGEFARVISHCGSFTNIRGGHNYPYLIRSTPRKPLRVFLQSGERDANIVTGNWPLANQQMASALEFAGYDHRFEFGVGGHNLRHGGALFADTLRWLFRS